jgi:hypothetical protein
MRGLRDVFTVAGGPVAHTFAVTMEMTLEELRLHVDTAPTTSGVFSVALNSVRGAEHDMDVYNLNLATGSTTDVWLSGLGLHLVPGDALDVAYANADARTIGVQFIFG